MKPDVEDRLSDSQRKSSPAITMIVAIVAIAVIIAVWLFSGGEPEPELAATEPAQTAVPEPEPAPELPPAPDIPEPAPVPEPAPEQPEEPAPPPPVSLETSDEELRERLAGAGDSEILDSALSNENLVERGAGLVDSFSKGIVLQKLLPLPKPEGEFAVVEANGLVTIDPSSYQRYDRYAEAFEELDTAALVASFHRFRPLLEQAYQGLGHPAEDFDNAVIRVLDEILATPQIDAPLQVKKHVKAYKYVDPALEQRSGLQKQLLRMGPENTARIQAQARALRAALLQDGP
jgi:hypothetical protein